jgi:hypothetical protein
MVATPAPELKASSGRGQTCSSNVLVVQNVIALHAWPSKTLVPQIRRLQLLRNRYAPAAAS